MTSLYNQLVGLSLFSGSNLLSSFYSDVSNVETPAVRKARAAFDAPATLAPWLDPSAPTDALAQVRAMRSLVDAKPDSRAGENIDVQTAFTTYKTLTRLQTLAETAAKSTTPATERAALQKAFSRGMADLQAFLGNAKSDELTLAFDTVSSSVKSIGLATSGGSARSVVAPPVATARDAAIPGLAGNEVISISLAKYGFTDSVTVDLSTVPQPPTLDGVVAALNAQIASVPATDAGGNPIYDGSGNLVSRYQARFSAKRIDDGEWALAYDLPGSETVKMSQQGGGDSLTVIAGISSEDRAATAQIKRYDDPTANLASNLTQGGLSAIDQDATDKAKLAQDQAKKPKLPSGTELPKIDPTVYAALDVRAVATDASGNSYVVGSTAGDFGSNLSSGAKDLYLTKLDSQGKVIWQRSLGIENEAIGAAINIDGAGNVTVAGTVTGRIAAPAALAASTDKDMFVTRFSATGEQTMFAALPSAGDETANAVAVDASGNIYIGGRSADGGTPVLMRLDAAGRVQEERSFSGSGNITALAFDPSGELLALTSSDGQSELHRLDAAALATDLASFNLGGVFASAMAISDTGEIAIAGTTNVAVAGGQANALSGGQDGFVTHLSTDFSTALTSYVGTGDDEQIDSVAFVDGKIFVSGRTEGALGGTLRGEVDGFVARVDMASGTVEEVNQFGIGGQTTGPVRLAVSKDGGGSALNALGLPNGELAPVSSSSLVSQAGLKAGDSFSVVIDGNKTIKFEIEAGDTLDSLMRRMAQKLKGVATVTTPNSDGMRALSIYAQAGHSLSLVAGPAHMDVLAKLGMPSGQIKATAIPDEDAPKVSPGGNFNLGLSQALSIDSKTNAEYALKMVKAAVSMTQSAYRSLYWDDSKAMLAGGGVLSSGGNAYTQSRLAAYQAALARLSV